MIDEIAELRALLDRAERERDEARADATSFASEALVRCAQRDEARSALAASRAEVERVTRESADYANRLDDWRLKYGEARAETAGLREALVAERWERAWTVTVRMLAAADTGRAAWRRERGWWHKASRRRDLAEERVIRARALAEKGDGKP